MHNNSPLLTKANIEFQPNARSAAVLAIALLLSLFYCGDVFGAKKGKVFHKTPPDLTKGGKQDDTHDWSLGPIGANGWVFNKRVTQGSSGQARQILITWVDKNGPSNGKLQLNDVILGINGMPFSSDARKVLAAAINDAEKKANKGKLSLNIWRKGQTLTVPLTIEVLGSYSKTAPWNCAKTDQIVQMAGDFMKTKELKPGWLGEIDALGMLATGREDLLPLVKAYAHQICVPGEVLSIDKHVSMMCWRWSYKLIFLSEYYLATGDKHVLPTITEYATKVAMGQSGAGTWGHTYAAIENTGSLHGHLGGYGAINQMGLTLIIGLQLAEKCGVKNDEISAAIKRGYDFFGYFIGKGTIPYGDHGAANTWFDDNGKSGAAAIIFDIAKNKEGQRFFSEMVLGSTGGAREQGHTGCFWSHLWGGIGAARAGELGLQSFMSEMNWAFTLERQPNGRMAYQGNAGEGGNSGTAKTKWDSTGSRLLQLCVPKRKLYITGKNTSASSHLTQARIDQVILRGRLYYDPEARKELKEADMFALLKDPLPPVRAIGAKALADANINAVDKLIPMLDSKNKYERYGAAEALCKAGFGNKAAAEKLIRVATTNKDITFKTYAIEALINRDTKRGLLSAAQPAIPALLKMATEYSPEDPRKILQHDIARALFYKGNAQPRRGLIAQYGLDGVDRSLLIPAMQELMTNDNGAARSNIRYVYPLLGDEELNLLWGDIYKSARDLAPSGIMFASGIRTSGLELLAKHKIKEGLPLSAWYLRHMKPHGSSARMPQALKIIKSYGGHAKEVIPEMEKHAAYWETKRRGGKVSDKDQANAIRAAIKEIQAMPESKDALISISKHLKKIEN